MCRLFLTTRHSCTYYTAQFGEVVSVVKDKVAGTGAQGDAVSTTEEETELTPQQIEDVIVDEIGGVLWRLVYLKRADLTEEHVLEFAK